MSTSLWPFLCLLGEAELLWLGQDTVTRGDVDAPAKAPGGVRHPEPFSAFSPPKRGCRPWAVCLPQEGMERHPRQQGPEQAAGLLHGWISLWEHQCLQLCLYFSVVAASSACCLLPPLAWGGQDRGAGAALALQCHLGMWQQGAEQMPASCRKARCAGQGRGLRAGSAAGVAQGMLPGYNLPMLFPRAGAVGFGSREGSPQGAGMIHRVN